MSQDLSLDPLVIDAVSRRPRAHYKYCQIGDRLFELLTNRQLYFAHQRELNDPQDCRYSMGSDLRENLFGRSLRAMHSTLMERMQGRFPLCQQHFEEWMRPLIFSEAWQTDFEEKMLFGELGWGVCCFTEDSNNELMWSHYARSHTGICLEFNFSHTPALGEKLWPVKYASEMPVINSFDELPDALLTKHTQWAYEREWRLLKMLGGSESFNHTSLTAIYFGAKSEPMEIQRVMETCRSAGYTINFYKAKLARDSYALSFDLM